MSRLPRIAVGTVQPEADGTAMMWALMDAMQRWGLRVQNFLSCAYFPVRDGATAITGLAPRHLDSWLMSEDLCRDLFVLGCRSSDLAIVEGRWRSALRGDAIEGGSLERLCGWLDLPRLAIVDARLLSKCQLPDRPEGLDALLLDRVVDAAELSMLQTQFEAIWKVPVLGWLDAAGTLRGSIQDIPGCGKPPLCLCHALGDRLMRHAPLERIYRLAGRRPLRAARPTLARPIDASQLRVAVAYDDAFGCYFPDTLDWLESRGATVCDFSPLHDDRLPPLTDVVYFGCGKPELFADELAQNDCMILALKSHLCGGRRIYAECGGLAYLCQQMELPDGKRVPMVGAIPATARLNDAAPPPVARELTLVADTWLGQAPVRWRGYLNARWNIAPNATIHGCAAEAGHELDVVHQQQAVGSRLHVNFAAQEALLESFFSPHPHSSPAWQA